MNWIKNLLFKYKIGWELCHTGQEFGKKGYIIVKTYLHPKSGEVRYERTGE